MGLARGGACQASSKPCCLNFRVRQFSVTVRNEDMVSVHAHLGVLERPEAAHEKSGADEKQERKRHLTGNHETRR